MGIRIAIISPNRNVWSETFIANHIAHLPGVELVLTDGHLPRRDRDGAPLIAPTLLKRVLQRAKNQGPEDLLRSTIARRLERARLDVVLAEYGPTGEAMAPICRAMGIPLVVHFHGIDAFHEKLLKASAGYARMIREAAAIVVVSREMERQLLQLGCPREKLHYSCYGIDVERFTPASAADAPKRFLAVGRFVDKKAPHLTLMAFKRAWQEDQALRLTMAGTGPLWESTKQLARAEGMGDAVEFTGVLDPEQVAGRMRTVRGFVQHSVVTAENDHEGTPLSILEAMASALPVIATRHGGIPDVVEHEVTGLLCDERDVDAMARHILRTASDPALAARLGSAGRERVLHDHRLEDSLKRLHGILEEAARKAER